MVVTRCSCAFAVVGACVLVVAGAADSRTLRPGGQLVHGSVQEEPLVGSADIQSLADLANSYEVVRGMRAVPFGRDAIIQLGVLALAPLLPLALTVLPAEEILKRLAGMLL
jgi:hypothetical protein